MDCGDEVEAHCLGVELFGEDGWGEPEAGWRHGGHSPIGVGGAVDVEGAEEKKNFVFVGDGGFGGGAGAVFEGGSW